MAHYYQQPHPHVHIAPARDYNTYDNSQPDDSNVAVSQTSPLIHNHGPYPHACIPSARSHMHSSVPNSEASFPNQAPPVPAQYGNQIPPGQRWARPMPEQPQPNPAPVHVQHHRRRSSQNSQLELTQNLPRRSSLPHSQPQPSFDNGYHYASQGYAPAPAPVAPYQQQASDFAPYPQAPIHAYAQEHQAPVVNHYAHNHDFQHAQVQHQASYQNVVPPAVESGPTYGTYAPVGHVEQVQGAQNGRIESYNESLDTEGLLLATSFDFAAASADLEVSSVPAQEGQPFEHYQSQQGFEQPTHHGFEQHQHVQHFEPQQGYQHFEQPHFQPQPQNGLVEQHGHQFHPQFHHEAQVQAHHQQFVTQPHANPNSVAQGYSHQHQAPVQHQHTRRGSGYESQHEQPSPPAAKKVRLGHRQQRSASSSQLSSLSSANPLQYPETSSPQPGQVLQQPGETATTVMPGHEQPQLTGERREAIGYQRDLEVQLRERLLRHGKEVAPGYAPSEPGSDEDEEEGDTEDDFDEYDHDHSHELQYPHSHHAPAPTRVQPIVPSQAHERAHPMPVANSAQTLDKKDAPAPAPKKPALACLFCRKRKIACGPPPPDSADRTCNQCLRRKQPCEYPTESRRGIRKTPKEPAVPADQEPQPTVHKFVHGDGSSLTGGDVKGKGRRKRVLELVD
ncbi:hypothetical protein FRC07_007503 [Ceratobasidium sp. 392]|nr:hypothetical protein FRC07_007503 [Ceratobasidium sp. 392]